MWMSFHDLSLVEDSNPPTGAISFSHNICFRRRNVSQSTATLSLSFVVTCFMSISLVYLRMSLFSPSTLIGDWWSGVSRCLTLCYNPWLTRILNPSGFPPLLDEVIIARRVCASIVHSAQELSIHTYCSLCASVKSRTSTETQRLNQSPMHIKIGDLTECPAQWAK